MNLAELEKHAVEIRKELKVPKQNEVFEVATEAGFLVAHADGVFDEKERAVMVKAIEVLSVGAIVEWEVETLLDACADRAKGDGDSKRAEHVAPSSRRWASRRPACCSPPSCRRPAVASTRRSRPSCTPSARPRASRSRR